MVVRQPRDGRVALLLAALPLLDLAREEVPDAAGCRFPELVAHLPAHDVEACLDRDLRDPGAHRTETDDTDAADVHGGECNEKLGRGAKLARAEPEKIDDVRGHEERVRHHVAPADRGRGGDDLPVRLGDEEKRVRESSVGEIREARERWTVGRLGVADHDRATPAYRGRNGRRGPGAHPR